MGKAKRVNWIDAARGIGIIAIVIGHSYLPGYTSGPIFEFAYAFHVPLFMFLSGLLFRPEKFGVGRLVASRVRSVLVPYLIWATASILLFALLGSFAGSALGRDADAGLLQQFLNMAWSNPIGGTMRWNTPLWFLTALVIVQLTTWVIAQLTGSMPKHEWVALGLAVLLSIIAITTLRGTFLPWSTERAVMLLPFFVLGMLFRSRAAFLEKFGTWGAAVAGLMCWIVMMVLTRTNGLVDYVAKAFGNPILWALAALLGIAGAVFIGKAAEDWAWLRYLGAASLTILVLHKFPVVAQQVLLSVAGVQLTGVPAMATMLAVGAVALVLSCACHPVLSRFFPESIGLRRPKLSPVAPRRALPESDS